MELRVPRGTRCRAARVAGAFSNPVRDAGGKFDPSDGHLAARAVLDRGEPSGVCSGALASSRARARSSAAGASESSLSWTGAPRLHSCAADGQRGVPIVQGRKYAIANKSVKPNPDFMVYLDRAPGMADVGWTSSPNRPGMALSKRRFPFHAPPRLPSEALASQPHAVSREL
jgi:hypothetical protein